MTDDTISEKQEELYTNYSDFDDSEKNEENTYVEEQVQQDEQSEEPDLISSALADMGIETEDSLDNVANNVNESSRAQQKEEQGSILLDNMITPFDRQSAVRLRLIPKRYEDARFDTEKIKVNMGKIIAKYEGLYTIMNFKAYSETCNGILGRIRQGYLPKRSWLIGAPKGFGKESFVTECIITMNKRNMKAVPYISLLELAEIKVAEEQRLLAPYGYKTTEREYSVVDGFRQDTDYLDMVEPENLMKRPQLEIEHYSWSEYMNSACLFVYMSDVMSKEIESYTLAQVLRIRGTKGLPTICMMETSLEPYKQDARLSRFVWDEILNDNKQEDSLDKIFHISCYKVRANSVKK